MLKQTGSVLSAALLAVCCCANAGDASDFKSKPLTAKFNKTFGLVLASPVADLSFTSVIMAIEPPWRARRFFSEDSSKPLPEARTATGYKIALEQTNGTHEFKLNEYSCKVSGNTAIVTLNCEATADIPNHFEYSAFAIPAGLVTGAEYRALLANGKTVKNTIPSVEPDKVSPLFDDQPVRKISFTTTLGSLSFEVLEGPGFKVVDRRGVPYADRKAFWIGYQRNLDYGSPFRSVIKVRFKIADDLVVAEPLPVKTSEPLPVESVADGITVWQPQIPLLPAPKKCELMQQNFAVNPEAELSWAITGIDDQAEFDRLSRAAVRTFGKMGIKLGPAVSGPKPAASVIITIDPKSMDNPEGYKLGVSPDRIEIVSPSPCGAFYAMQTLRPLRNDQGIQACQIEDWPDLELRAAHLLVDDYSKVFHTNLINDVLVPMKYNAIVPELQYVQWDAAKDVRQKGGMPKADYVAMVKLCKENYIDVIPLLQTLGHCGWMFPEREDGTRANLDLAEDESYPYAYNTANPRLYPYIEKILDEVIAASGNPKILHIGHDEVFHSKAKFPCRPENVEKGIKKLMFDDLMWYYNYGKKHNLKIMLWHDLFVTKEESPENGAGGAPYNMAELRPELPRDLIFAVWRYDGRNTEFADMAALKKEGFQVVGAPWFETNNVENVAKFTQKVGGLGLLQTIWCGYNGNRIVTHNGFFQLVPYVRTGLSGWNTGYNADGVDPSEVICNLMCNWKNNTPAELELIDITPVTNLSLAAGNNPFLRRETYGLDKLPAGKTRVGQVMFNLPSHDGAPAAIALKSRLNPQFPEAVSVPLNRTAGEIYCLATSINSTPEKFQTIATMKAVYADGSSETLPLQYTWQIGGIEDSFNFHLSTENVLQWKTDGRERRLWFFTWKNPFPQKIIERLEFAAGKDLFSFYVMGISLKK
ncbi:MAG: glycoside hydrolase family 20 zincin-like fold domain-containing protein [Victivallaceae bacterium]|nr:glycoside hydrolase family 20 zincin-like fold domain-containing protein [Victivallaceae bacterium]